VSICVLDSDCQWQRLLVEQRLAVGRLAVGGYGGDVGLELNGVLAVVGRPDRRRHVPDALVASGTKAGAIKDRARIPSQPVARQRYLGVSQRLAV